MNFASRLSNFAVLPLLKRKPVGLLYDNLTDNTGDKAVGIVMQRLLCDWGVAHEVVSALAVDPSAYSRLIVGGGELIAPPGDPFYDAFRVRGRHALNAVGLRSYDGLEYLAEYEYLSVRSAVDAAALQQAVPGLSVALTPCPTMLLEPMPSGVAAEGCIGVHLHHGIAARPVEIAAVLREIAKEVPLFFIPFTHYACDGKLMEVLAEEIPNSRVAPRLPPQQLFELVGRLRGLLSASLHASLFAYAQHVPCAAFAVAPKIAQFFGDRGMESWLVTTAAEAGAALRKLLACPPDYSRAVANDQRLLAEHLARLRELLPSGPASPRQRHLRPVQANAARLHKAVLQYRNEILGRLAVSAELACDRVRYIRQARALEERLTNLKQLLQEAHVAAEKRVEEIGTRDAEIGTRDAEIAARDTEIIKRNNEAATREAAIKERDALVVELQGQLAESRAFREAIEKLDPARTIDELTRSNADSHAAAARLSAAISDRDERLRNCLAEIEQRDERLRNCLVEIEQRDERIRELTDALESRAATPAASDLPSAPAPTDASPKPAAGNYEDIIAQIRRTVHERLEAHARIAVVSRGDGELLKLPDHTGWHYPQSETGEYAGYYPADSFAAIQHVEELRGKGADYLLFPATGFWWLTHYSDLRGYLDARFKRVYEGGDCVIFALNPPGLSGGSRHAPREAVADETMSAAATLEVLAKARLAAFLAAGARLVFPKVDDPLVSVVIPTYQQAHHTLGTLASLLTCAAEIPWELVIVDNASTDQTRILLQRLENANVRFNERNVGFGNACNQGVAASRGRFVLLLNNDVLVSPGCLATLVQCLESRPEAAAAGGKLVHPDGKLQEAGSVIWSDGSTVGYGRGESPDAPAYNYVREVDYCSAACLLVRKDVFTALGGFDARYAPAYYEDADLCMGMLKSGRTIVYQPQAVVIHMEFSSSGRDRAVALQLHNRRKFVTKWRYELARQMPPAPAHVALARDRRAGRRVLVLDDRIPSASIGSGFPRARAILESLAQLGYVASFLPVSDTARHEPATAELQQMGIEVLCDIKNVSAELERRAGMYDAALVSRPHNFRFIKTIKQFNPNAAIVYDAEAVFAARDNLQAEVEGRAVLPEEAEARIRAEVALMADADVVLTVAEPESRLVREYGRDIDVRVWGDCQPVWASPRKFADRRDLLFVGSLATPPNADALRHALREIFPRVRAELDCRLLVAGANPPAGMFDGSTDVESVVCTGFVRDLSQLYDQCRVFVAPHRFAGGVPHKVIEAMAAGIPCVVSELLGRQLEASDGEEVLIARDACEFAEKTIRLYRDESLWQHLRENALRLVRQRYDPERMRALLRQCMEDAMLRTWRKAPPDPSNPG